MKKKYNLEEKLKKNIKKNKIHVLSSPINYNLKKIDF